MRLRLPKSQNNNAHVEELQISKNLSKVWEKVKGILQHPKLFYVSKIIYFELINYYHNNLLAGHFEINKTCEFIARKYFWSTLCHNNKTYVKGHNICLSLKAVYHKPYSNFQFLLILTHW